MANPIGTFKDVLHHLVEYARFDDEADKNIAHNLIDLEYPAAAQAPAAQAPANQAADQAAAQAPADQAAVVAAAALVAAAAQAAAPQA